MGNRLFLRTIVIPMVVVSLCSIQLFGSNNSSDKSAKSSLPVNSAISMQSDDAELAETSLQSLLNFEKTLRLNYIFTGGIGEPQISLYSQESYQGWWGRRHNLNSIPVFGNGQITLIDTATNQTLYTNSFSTLFSEWLTTAEAKRVRKAFENVFLIPMPCNPAMVTIKLFGIDNKLMAQFSHIVNPSDILIKPHKVVYDEMSGEVQGIEFKYIKKGGDSRDCIDVAIISEGYTAQEKEKFYRDAQISADEIMSYAPFNQFGDRFNYVALFVPSDETGVSIPNKFIWKETALRSHFDTFYMDRYLTTLNIFRLHDYLSIVPYEHIIILANTSNYGGGGIYNSYVLSAASNEWHKPVVVHEFGHSFGALADEYFYDDEIMAQYSKEFEPWEQNITTLSDFKSKWQDMLAPDNQIVTKAMQGPDYLKKLSKEDYKVGLYEGGGYQSVGVYRPYPTCRMRDNTFAQFCPVCERAIQRIILFNTEELK